MLKFFGNIVAFKTTCLRKDDVPPKSERDDMLFCKSHVLVPAIDAFTDGRIDLIFSWFDAFQVHGDNMGKDENGDTEQRDKLLLRLLKTPPQPRPKRDRGKEQSTQIGVKRANVGKRAPSA